MFVSRITLATNARCLGLMLCMLPDRGTAQTPQDARSITREWVSVERAISRETNEAERMRILTRDRIAVLEAEINQLRAEGAGSADRATRAERERAALAQTHPQADFTQSVAVLGSVDHQAATLVKPDGFSAAEVANLAERCARTGLVPLYLPGRAQPHQGYAAQFITSPAPALTPIHQAPMPRRTPLTPTATVAASNLARTGSKHYHKTDVLLSRSGHFPKRVLTSCKCSRPRGPPHSAHSRSSSRVTTHALDLIITDDVCRPCVRARFVGC